MKSILLAISILALVSCKENKPATTETLDQTTTSEAQLDSKNEFKINPILHATMVLEWDGKTIYIDPVGDSLTFNKYAAPDLILITDIHGDHFDLKTIKTIATNKVKIIAPQAVAEKMPQTLKSGLKILNNGDETITTGLTIYSIPMYNLREEALTFHSKGRGNGYVIEKDGMRVYISGDTEDIPEMRNLKDIDIAFVCMNLPYTMTVKSAASAVLDFKPKKVYPYHYRGSNGLSDVTLFKDLISQDNKSIEVVQLDWYPED